MPPHGEHTARPVVAFATDMAAGAAIAPHAHRRGQLLHATEGVMLIRADSGSWVVPRDAPSGFHHRPCTPSTWPPAPWPCAPCSWSRGCGPACGKTAE
ncbi:hypothetical protein ACHFCA_16230 [Delftia tsuruhatensis]